MQRNLILRLEMQLQLATLLIICLGRFIEVFAQGMPITPCPKIFQYRFDGSEWFGLMAIHSPESHHPLHLRVTLSMRGKPTTNYLGEIELLTRGQFASHAAVLYKIRFPKHHFPPKVLLISANNQVICFGTGEQSIFMTQIQLEHIRKLAFIPDKKISLLQTGEVQKMVAEETVANQNHGLKRPHPQSSQTQLKKKLFTHLPKEMCGRINRGYDIRLKNPGGPLDLKTVQETAKSSDTITSPVFADDDDSFAHIWDDSMEMSEADSEDDVGAGSLPSIIRGSWPWLAAIYVNNLTSLDFQCGGTLVSGRAVISSAHCFEMFNSRYTANEVLVFLGRHNLKNWNEEGSLAAPVDGIYIHPDYNSQLSSYDADIAVIVLKDAVRFNTFIRPACLWSGSSKPEYIVGEHGIVIGWSFDKSNTTAGFQTGMASSKKVIDTSIPKMVKAPIVSSADCFRANAHFRSLSSNRTFCAGVHFESHHGAIEFYTGISGAGLLIFRNNRWMLRGTVSAALPAEKPQESEITHRHCCGNQLMVYADVAKFLDWITAFII
ncbi:uncharacterized protein Dana_GF19315, isoform E [Drosophila ananassae]|uniref:Uncharacterized protein, isoform E n=2 Tax=Drosophila ananassae TaxID=7217 RepID=A0A0P8XKI6_DROAN|nr:serine protease gd isoform X3 [Drosophila ananassae]KPU75277.1 uncharacterized protein Dana_GF19315, isoform E [Drosophila ananassae]